MATLHTGNHLMLLLLLTYWESNRSTDLVFKHCGGKRVLRLDEATRVMMMIDDDAESNSLILPPPAPK
jgi:hypothetical protein